MGAAGKGEAAQGPYEAFVAEYYDYLPPVAGRRDIDFFLRKARELGDPILELGCGTGRVLLPLSKAGNRVVGLDLSGHMLGRCRTKLKAEQADVQERVTLIQRDMTDFELTERFTLISVPFRPFQHLLTVKQQIACLNCAKRHLAKEGQFILDVFHTDPRRMHDPAYQQESAPHPDVVLPDGRKVRLSERTAQFHRAEQINDVEMFYNILHPDGREERLIFAFRLRYFLRFEVEHLLARCGLALRELYGDYDRRPLEDSSPEMIFVAQAAH